MLSLDVCVYCVMKTIMIFCVLLKSFFEYVFFNINYFFIFQKDFGDFLPFGVLPTLMEQVLI